MKNIDQLIGEIKTRTKITYVVIDDAQKLLEKLVEINKNKTVRKN